MNRCHTVSALLPYGLFRGEPRAPYRLHARTPSSIPLRESLNRSGPQELATYGSTFVDIICSGLKEIL